MFRSDSRRSVSHRPQRSSTGLSERLENRTLLSAGDFDRSFSGDGKLLSDNAVFVRNAFDVAVQNDGRVLVIGQRRRAGDFSLGQSTDIALTRFNANGSLDTTFGTGGSVVADLGGYDTGYRVLSQGNRRIIAGSTQAQPDGSAQWVLHRFHPDGSPDATFDTDGVTRVPAGINGGLSDIALAPDGKLLAVGRTAASRFTVMRFTASGQPDPTFDGDGVVTLDFTATHDDYAAHVAVQPDGRVVVAGNATRETTTSYSSDIIVARLTPAGAPDPNFDGDGKLVIDRTPQDAVRGLALDTAGRPVLAGESTSSVNRGQFVLRRTTTGAADPSFGGGDGEVVLDTTDYQYAVLTTVGVAPDGDIVAAGYAQANAIFKRDFFIARLDDAGNRLAQWTDDFHADDDEAWGVAFAPDGKLVATGSAMANGFTGVAVARYLDSGTRDATFDGDGRVTLFEGFEREIFDVVVQPDRKILVGGSQTVGPRKDFFLARYNPDGSPDTTFDRDGRVVTYLGVSRRGVVRSLLLLPDGRIVASGTATPPGTTFADVAVARFHPDGTLDTSFGGDGTVVNDFGTADYLADAADYAGGKLVIAGGPGLVRYNADGSLDRSFDGDGALPGDVQFTRWPSAVLVQGDKILADRSDRIVRYNADGSVDPTFASPELNPGNGTEEEDAYSYVTGLAFAPDGDVVALGHYHDHGDEREKYALWRLNADGTIDTAFGLGGRVIKVLDEPFHIEESDFAVQPDGRIVVTGYGESSDDGHFLSAVTRHLPDGSMDGTFGVEGVTLLDFPRAFTSTGLALDPTGDIVVAGVGAFGESGPSGWALVRLEGTGTEGGLVYDRNSRVLSVKGNSTGDTIHVSASRGRVFVHFNGRLFSYTRTSLRGVRVYGRDGNDTLTVSGDIPDLLVEGNAGDDTLRGGSGDETLSGRDGNDSIDGGLGSDILLGGNGTDTVDYRSRTRDLVLGPGEGMGEAGENDTLGSFEKVYGGSGNDRITVASFFGAVFAGAGNDTLFGSSGDDALWGEAGDDLITVSNGNDYLRGGTGVDTYNAFDPNGTANLDVSLDGVANDGRWFYFGGRIEEDNVYTDIENVIGGRGDDRITGSSANNRLEGGDGHDTLVGLSGNDTMLGGNGDDTLIDTQGTNTIGGGPGIDTVNGATEPTTGTVLQAENATRTRAAVSTQHAGYTGSGYVEYIGPGVGTIAWTYSAPTAGRRTIVFRYANGNSFSPFTLALSVNGTPVQAPEFRTTGAWTTWRTIELEVDLRAGNNTISLSANPTELIVDWMMVQ